MATGAVACVAAGTCGTTTSTQAAAAATIERRGPLVGPDSKASEMRLEKHQMPSGAAWPCVATTRTRSATATVWC